MSDIIDVKTYEIVRSEVIRNEQNLLRNLSSNPLSQIEKTALDMSIESIYPNSMQYNSYNKLNQNNTNTTHHSMESVNYLVMKNAVNFGNYNLSKDDYLDIISSSYNKVGFENIEIMLAIDDEGINTTHTFHKHHNIPITIAKNTIELYKEFFNLVQSHFYGKDN